MRPAKTKRSSQAANVSPRPEKRRKFRLRDESDDVAQVHISEPVASDHPIEAEKPVSQNEAVRSSKSLKRLSNLSSDTPTSEA